MGIADEMRKLTESSSDTNDDKELKFRLDQLHKMIETKAKSGGRTICVSRNFFRGAVGEKLTEKLTSEGFKVSPSDVSMNGDSFLTDWMIDWL